jgi:hypothetical protein
MSEYVIGASVPEPENQEDQFKKQDPFNKAWEDLKGFNGLDSNFKRRSTRMAKTLDMPPTQTILILPWLPLWYRRGRIKRNQSWRCIP